MKASVRRYVGSAVIAFVLTVLVAAIGSTSVLPAVGFLLLPGIFAAALIFPQGIHSDFPLTYMAVAALMNVFVFSLLILGLWAAIERRRQPR